MFAADKLLRHCDHSSGRCARPLRPERVASLRGKLERELCSGNGGFGGSDFLEAGDRSVVRGNRGPGWTWPGEPQKFLEARGGIEPPIKALQALALPLGDRATDLHAIKAHHRTKTKNPPAGCVSGGGRVQRWASVRFYGTSLAPPERAQMPRRQQRPASARNWMELSMSGEYLERPREAIANFCLVMARPGDPQASNEDAGSGRQGRARQRRPESRRAVRAAGCAIACSSPAAGAAT